MITHSKLRKALKHYYASKSWCSYFSKDPQVIESLKNFTNKLAKNPSVYRKEYLPKEEIFNLFCILTSNAREFEDYHLEDFFEMAMSEDSFKDFQYLREVALKLRQEIGEGKGMTLGNFLNEFNKKFSLIEDERIVYKYGC